MLALALHSAVRQAPAAAPLLKSLPGQGVAYDAVGLVELSDLAEWSVGDEIHRVLTVLHRYIHGKLTEAVYRIEGDQASATIRFNFPARTQVTHVGHLAEQCGTLEGGI